MKGPPMKIPKQDLVALRETALPVWLRTAANLLWRALLIASLPALFAVGMIIYLARLPWTWAKHRGNFSVAKAFGFGQT